MLALGLMSGTSMDGIDAALLETDGTANFLQRKGEFSLRYEKKLQKKLKAAEKAAYKKTLSETDLNDLIQQSTELHTKTVFRLLKKYQLDPQDITVIGYHGQTLLHQPEKKISLVIGNGPLLARNTGITVINNFRAADINAGGQGAPLAPLYHQALLIASQKKQVLPQPCVFVNCGGIANLTFIPDNNPMNLLAFDIGPGNALIDRLVRLRTQGREMMDQNGKYGSRGRTSKKLLEMLFEKAVIQRGKNYFSKNPPKSLDTHDMTLLPAFAALPSLPDACRTLAAFTAESIIQSIGWLPEIPVCWILAGGGWLNPVIYNEFLCRLRHHLGRKILILKAEEAGWQSCYMEAQLFAFLAVRSLKGLPISFPRTTGVPVPLSGGEIHKPVLCGRN